MNTVLKDILGTIIKKSLLLGILFVIHCIEML